jgi:hypothetical protein
MTEAHICIDVAIKYNLHKKIIIQYRKSKNKNKYTNKKYGKKKKWSHLESLLWASSFLGSALLAPPCFTHLYTPHKCEYIHKLWIFMDVDACPQFMNVYQ